MAIDRRTVLLGSALALCARSRVLADVPTSSGEAALVSACRRHDGRYALVVLSMNGRVLREIGLSDRGHDIAVDTARARAVAFSRRPGSFAIAFSTLDASAPHVFAARDDRTFSGHGVFADRGRLLFATENDVDSGEGLLGIYDTATWQRIGEIATHGIDPHEVILLGDGCTLVVANGGIEMSGREKLNIAAMRPSLVFIDSISGELKAKHELPASLNQLSIRHIAADRRGQVWFGGQWEGALMTAPELVGRASVERPLRLIETAAPMGTSLKGYIGSVAISADGRILAAAAPRAGRTIFVDTDSGLVSAETILADGCGVAGLADGAFALSSGHGDLLREAPGQPPVFRTVLDGTAFDNHLRRLG